MLGMRLDFRFRSGARVPAIVAASGILTPCLWTGKAAGTHRSRGEIQLSEIIQVAAVDRRAYRQGIQAPI